MSTLGTKDFTIMQRQLEDAGGKMISKEMVLFVIQNKLKEVDAKNDLVVDRIDGAVLKEIYNSIIKIPCQ